MGGMQESCHTCRILEVDNVKGMCEYYALTMPPAVECLCRNELPKGRKGVKMEKEKGGKEGGEEGGKEGGEEERGGERGEREKEERGSMGTRKEGRERGREGGRGEEEGEGRH